jgi:hypothetical protein
MENPMSHKTPEAIAILDRHRQNETITRKQFAHAIDVSDRTADRIFTDGWDALAEVTLAFQNLPLPLAFDLITSAVRGRFNVTHSGAVADGCQGVHGAMKIAKSGAELGMTILRADSDKIRTHEEVAEILEDINDVRRVCDSLEAENLKLTGRRAG